MSTAFNPLINLPLPPVPDAGDPPLLTDDPSMFSRAISGPQAGPDALDQIIGPIGQGMTQAMQNAPNSQVLLRGHPLADRLLTGALLGLSASAPSGGTESFGQGMARAANALLQGPLAYKQLQYQRAMLPYDLQLQSLSPLINARLTEALYKNREANTTKALTTAETSQQNANTRQYTAQVQAALDQARARGYRYKALPLPGGGAQMWDLQTMQPVAGAAPNDAYMQLDPRLASAVQGQGIAVEAGTRYPVSWINQWARLVQGSYGTQATTSGIVPTQKVPGQGVVRVPDVPSIGMPPAAQSVNQQVVPTQNQDGSVTYTPKGQAAGKAVPQPSTTILDASGKPTVVARGKAQAQGATPGTSVSSTNAASVNATLADLDANIAQVDQHLNAMKDPKASVPNAVLAQMLNTPESRIGAFLQGEIVSHLTPDQRHLLFALRNLREVGLKSRGIGTLTPLRNVQELNMLTAQLPGAETLTSADPAIIREQLASFKTGIDNVRRVLKQRGIVTDNTPSAPAAANPTQFKTTAVNAQGVRIGSNDGGATWYDVSTGKPYKP